MNYTIYGGGPTGLTLAYYLLKNNNKVTLVEKDVSLGGCWKQEWVDDMYFSEHSPRVLINNNSFFDLLDEIKYDYRNKLVPTYGNVFQTNKKFIYFFIQNLTFRELLLLAYGKFIGTADITVMEWMKNNNFSEKGIKAITVFCIALANSPDKLMIRDLFMATNNIYTMFYELTNNQEWLDHIEKTITRMGCIVYKGYELIQLDEKNNIIVSSIIRNKDHETKIISDKHILTLPPLAFGNLLKNQSEKIQNNWFKYDVFKNWVEESHYISFGFQLHFDYELNLDDKPWCWSCMNDYNVIILPTSKYLKEFTRDKRIKTVWSCTVVDTSVFIKDKNMTVNDMSKYEVVNNIINILKVKPFKITFYDGLNKIDGKWISKDSAFSTSKYGVIKPKGTIENLYTVGPHNMRGITTIGKAIDSAKIFLNIKKKNNIFIQIILLLLIIWILKELLA